MSEFEHSQHWDGQDRRTMPPPPPPNHGVKFDPTVNLGHILTFIGFMVAIFTT